MGAQIQVNGSSGTRFTVPFGATVTLTNALPTGTAQKWEILELPLDAEGNAGSLSNFPGWSSAPAGGLQLVQTPAYSAVTFAPDVSGGYLLRLTSTEGGSPVVSTAVVRVLDAYSGQELPAYGETTEDGPLGWNRVRIQAIKRAAKYAGCVRVCNQTGGTLARGTLVELSSAVDAHGVTPNVAIPGATTEDVPLATVADNSASNATERRYAILEEAIANNGFGFARIWGLFSCRTDLSLAGYTAGRAAYVGTAGALTGTAPSTVIPIATVLASGSTGGKLFIGQRTAAGSSLPTGPGLVKVDGAGVGALAVAGTDYVLPSGLSYQTVAGAGSAVTARPKLNFTANFAVTDNSGASRTDVDLATTGVTPASYTYASLTVDAYGRLTAASSGAAPMASVAGSGLVKVASGVSALATAGTDFVTPSGVSGGQSITGGTGSGDNLTLVSTSHATKGQVRLGGASGLVWDDVNSLVLIGGASTSTTSALRLLGSKTIASATGAVWNALDMPSATLTLTGSSNVTGNVVALVQLQAPGLSAANALTVATAATLYVTGAPAGTGAGPATITNPWAAFFASRVYVLPSVTLPSAATVNYDGFVLDQGTLTLTGSTNVTNRMAALRVRRPVFTSSNAITGLAATVYIEGVPVFSGSFTSLSAGSSGNNAPALLCGGQMTIWPTTTFTPSSSSANWDGVYIGSGNGTVTFASTSGTIPTLSLVSMVTLQSGSIINGEARTVTSAATLYVNGPPGAGTNTTITNAWNIYSSLGRVFMSLGGNTADYASSFPGMMYVQGNTQTLANSGTAAVWAGMYHGRHTFTSASAVTITDAAGIYVANSPTNAGSVTLTNTWSILVAAGACRFGGDVVVGSLAANATSATTPFLYITSSAGAPTGVPTGYSGKVAFHYDSTNNKLYAYNGAWRSVAVT